MSNYKASTVRLVGGNTIYEGRVEVYYQGSWGTVCDDYWQIADAIVVCKQLGFSSASSAKCCAFFGQGSGNIVLDNVQCSGSETSIFNCNHNGYLSHNCGHSEDAGVICVP